MQASSQPWVMVTILGAGRSGTSAITRALSAVGVDLGDNLRKGSGKNPTGFFEDNDLLALNKKLKRALGIRGDSIRLIEHDEWARPEVRALADEAVELIRRRFGNVPLWGYKYGRTLRLLPFWQDVYRRLGVEDQYVVALRNPLSVARSRLRLDPHRGTQEKSDLEWLVNVVPYFQDTRGHVTVVVDYDNVMADPTAELIRLAHGLGRPLDDHVQRGIAVYRDEFLVPGIRHSRFSIGELERDPNLHPLARDAYRWLFRLCTDDVRHDDEKLWQDWARIAGAVRDLAPILRHCDRIEGELRAAQRNLLGPLQAIAPLWRNWRSS
ncbi:MAG TPA: hypothetical protein VEL28_23550 [Candidatus Binatia bacterium]|nr:hypothetical protein [Candidatus Binatia bacterium]